MSVTLGKRPYTITLLDRYEWEPRADQWAEDEEAMFRTRRRGMFQPLTTFCKSMEFSWQLRLEPDPATYPVAHISATWEMSEEAADVINEWAKIHGHDLALEMAEARPQLGFACGALQAWELRNRVNKAKAPGSKALPTLQELMKLIEDERQAVRDILKEEITLMLAELRDGPWTEKYIDEHETSSVLPGVKWAIFRGRPDARQPLLESVIIFWTYVLEHWDTYFNLSSPDCKIISPACLGTGGRQRTDKAVQVLTGSFSGDYRRSRLVQWNAVTNPWPFHPDSNRVYARIFDRVAKALKLDAHCPVSEGGKIWEMLYRDIESTGQYINRDGSAWENWVALIIGMTWFATIYGIPMLFSGHGFTSICGSVAHLLLTCALIKYYGLGIRRNYILGDDNGWVAESEKEGRFPDIEGLYEEDPKATKLHHYLGICILDVNRWHPIGLKVTQDKAESAFECKENEVHKYVCKIQPPIKQATVAMYKGVGVDGTPFRDVLLRANFRELKVIAPSYIRDQLIQDQAIEPDEDDMGDGKVGDY